MKRKALLLLFAAMFAFAGPAKAADLFLLGFTGFDYEEASAGFLGTGNSYHAVGFVTSVGATLSPYVVPTNENTFYLFDMVVATSTLTGTTLEVTFNPNGRVRFYESAVHDADYGVNPPNIPSPSTFTNGNVFLGADIDNFALVYDYGNSQGLFLGNATLDEGSDLFAIPPAQRGGWSFGGLAGQPNTTPPDGYVNQISGEMRIPDATPTSHKSWGAIKALYR